jgi:hypothetical protein
MIEFFQDSSVVNRLKDVSNRVLIGDERQTQACLCVPSMLGILHGLLTVLACMYAIRVAVTLPRQ